VQLQMCNRRRVLMQENATSYTPLKNLADKLSKAVIVSLLLGICFCFIYFVLEYVIGAGRDFRGLLALFSMLASIVLVYFVTPLLSIIAIINIFCNWRSIAYPDNSAKNGGLIHKIAYRYLIASILFVFSTLSLLPIVLEISIGSVQIRNLPAWLSNWLIIIALLALLMGCISYKLFTKTSNRGLARIGATFAIIVGLLVVGAVLWTTNFGSYFVERVKYSARTETFSGRSDSLKQTSFVPTLDSPCPENKNVIWCSSFQLAWNQMKDDVISAPIQVVGAEVLAARLNAAEQSADDLESRSFYVAAGRINQGIINRIEKDMAAKFPSHSLPDFSYIAAYPKGLLAYSYLIANVPFEYPYRQVRNDFIFTDSQGIETNVGAFGAWGFGQRYKKMREQAEILYFIEDYNEPVSDLQIKEFAIDLCKHSKPYQVVAAVIEPKDSLIQSLDYIHNQIADFKQSDNVDVLMVPEMFWEIDHRFEDLIGKIVSNADPPMPIVEAKQSIKFKLDRYGAILESEATFAVSAIPRYFMFNRPFLVYMKKRDCEQPFFVMWVDNAELLNRK